MSRYIILDSSNVLAVFSNMTMEERGVLITILSAEEDLNNIDMLKSLKVLSQDTIEFCKSMISKIDVKIPKYKKPKTFKKENHWNWKGGITNENKEIRNSLQYKNWRTKVFLRDNFTCQICGKTGGELNAHHIKSFSKNPLKRFELENGITLCKNCHKDIHKKGKCDDYGNR